MRLIRAGLKFRVELHADAEVVLRYFHGLDDPAVRRGAADDHACFCECLSVIVIELIAVAVAFIDMGNAIAARHLRALRDLARVAAEAQCAAHIDGAGLVRHEIDNLIEAVLVEFAGVCIRDAAHVAGILDDGNLHAEANAEVRDVALSCVLCGIDHTLDTAVAEAAWHKDTIAALEHFGSVFLRDELGINPIDLDLRAVLIAGMVECFDDGKICVMQFDIFADKTDGDGLFAAADLLYHAAPLGHIRLFCLEVQLAADNAGEIVFLQHNRCFVQHRDRHVFNNTVRFYVAEQGNLVENARIDRLIAAQDNDVRGDAHTLHFFYRVLGRFRLMLAGAFEVRHKRDMNEKGVFLTDLERNLTNGFEKRLAFDIACRAADLGDDDVCIRLVADAVNEVLDLVRDVRNDLNGLAKVLAAAFLVEDVPVDLAGREVGEFIQVFVDEALIVAEVKVGLCAILGHVNFAVLVRAHGARVNVDVRVKLLCGDL